MNLQHMNMRLPVDGPMNVDLQQMINVFHRWVPEPVTDEMPIDVADYRHVPTAASVLMVCLEADYLFESTDGTFGLRYNRKAPVEGGNDDRFLQALQSAAQVALLLEAEFPGLRFHRQTLKWTLNDRALAPNNDQTYEFCSHALPTILAERLGQTDPEFTWQRDPRSLFGAEIRLAKPLDLEGLTN